MPFFYYDLYRVIRKGNARAKTKCSVSKRQVEKPCRQRNIGPGMISRNLLRRVPRQQELRIGGGSDESESAVNVCEQLSTLSQRLGTHFFRGKERYSKHESDVGVRNFVPQ